MKQRTIFRFEGGPRAGAEVAKTRPARISTYIDEDAETVSVEHGDRIASKRTVGSIYRKERIEIDQDLNRIIIYCYVSNPEGN